MAISSIPTILSLQEFCEIMEISPWLFNQLDAQKIGAKTDYKAWMQFQHQTAATMSRENIALAISGAEEMLANELDYWPGPKAIVNEYHPYPLPFDATWRNIWATDRWTLKDVKLRYSKIIRPGIETFTELYASTPISFTDADGDGKLDTFTTAALATTVTDPDAFRLFYADADRVELVDGPETTWQIRPIRVELAAGFVTLSGPIWLVVKPNLMFRPVPQPLDPSDPLTFVANVKVSEYTIDDSQQGALIYEQPPNWCLPDSTDTIGYCTQAERTVCYYNRNADVGVVTPVVTDSTPVPPGFTALAPTKIRVNYVSGIPLRNNAFNGRGRLDPLYAQMIARLACTLLADRSGVTNSEAQIDYWRNYPTSGKGDRETLFISQQTANNPFGIRRGAVWAWSMVMQLNENHLSGAIT